MHALSCHVRIDDTTLSESQVILRQVTEMLSNTYNISTPPSSWKTKIVKSPTAA